MIKLIDYIEMLNGGRPDFKQQAEEVPIEDPEKISTPDQIRAYRAEKYLELRENYLADMKVHWLNILMNTCNYKQIQFINIEDVKDI